jgi:predicted metal-dependent hydrolase
MTGHAGGRTELSVDRLVRSRRRTVSLLVDEQACLIVRAPLRMPLSEIEQVVRQKEAWIRQHQARMKQRMAQRPQRAYAEGEGFLWLGRTLRLTRSGQSRQVTRMDSLLVVPDEPSGQTALRVAHWYREEARRTIGERVRLWAALMDVPVDRISITQAAGRWGSCSGRANLSFTARLIMAPLEVVDYVVVHELAHVTHKNHGPGFWELVASQQPDYGLHRRWLSENGHGLVI